MARVKCIGWWEQNGLGRQNMDGMWIEFSGRNLFGGGQDIVGAFTLTGTMQAEGAVRIIKQYHDKHTVVYLGQYDGEGLFFGAWAIDRSTGNWSIKLQHSSSESEEFADI